MAEHFPQGDRETGPLVPGNGDARRHGTSYRWLRRDLGGRPLVADPAPRLEPAPSGRLLLKTANVQVGTAALPQMGAAADDEPDCS